MELLRDTGHLFHVTHPSIPPKVPHVRRGAFFLDCWRKIYPSSMADSKGKQKHNIAWNCLKISQHVAKYIHNDARSWTKIIPARQVIFILLGAVSRLNNSCLGSPNRALDGEFSGSWRTRSQYQAKLMLFIFMDWLAGLFTGVEFWISQAFGGSYSLKTQLGQRGVLKRGSNPVGVMDGLRKHCCVVLGFGHKTSYTWIPRLPIFFGRHVCVPCFTSSPNKFLFPETQNTTLPRFPRGLVHDRWIYGTMAFGLWTRGSIFPTMGWGGISHLSGLSAARDHGISWHIGFWRGIVHWGVSRHLS